MGSDLGVGAPVPPQERRWQEREAARVVVVAGERFLLGERFDPSKPESRWWSAPGGGIDDGEDARTAAVREVAEELGIDVDPADLVGPVARRVVVHGYSDKVSRQAEDYFLLAVDAEFEPHARFQTERERVSSGPWRWFAAAELDGDEWLWDDVATLWALRDRPDEWVVDLGEQEQSSVPVS